MSEKVTETTQEVAAKISPMTIRKEAGLQPKGTNLELDERVGIVTELLIKRYTRQEILHFFSTHTIYMHLQLSSRMIDYYIKRARDIILESSKKNMAMRIGQAARTYELAIRKGFASSDIKTAVRAQSELCRLFGLNIEKEAGTGQINIGRAYIIAQVAHNVAKGITSPPPVQALEIKTETLEENAELLAREILDSSEDGNESGKLNGI